jgi:hypothetical protein
MDSISSCPDHGSGGNELLVNHETPFQYGTWDSGGNGRSEAHCLVNACLEKLARVKLGSHVDFFFIVEGSPKFVH